MLQVGNARHLNLDRDGDLLLDLFCGAPRPLGNDLHVVVGNVGIGLDRKIVEGDNAPGKEQDSRTHHEPAIVESEIDEAADHLWSHRILKRERIGDDLLSDCDARGDLLHAVG